MFSNVWQKKENEEEGKLGRKFSPKPTIFILPNREEKVGEKSARTTLFHKYPVLESSKKREEIALEKKKERMRVAPASARTFLNEKEKENKRRGIEIRITCVEEKKKKKEKKRKEKKNE